MNETTIADEGGEIESRPKGQLSVWLALTLLILAVGVGLLAAFNVGHAFEQSTMKAIAFREGATSEILITVVQWVTWMGDATQRSLVMVMFGAWLLWRRRPWAALVMIVIPPLSGAASSILKEIFGRARPDVVPHLDVVSSLSFPSGHATNVMVTYLLAALLIAQTRRPLWLVLAILLAGAIGASRPLLGVHWPSDVLGGWLWGAGFALLGLLAAQRLEARSKSETHANPDVATP